MTRRRMTDSESIQFNMLMDKMGITQKVVYNSILEDFIDSGIPFEILYKNPNLIIK